MSPVKLWALQMAQVWGARYAGRQGQGRLRAASAGGWSVGLTLTTTVGVAGAQALLAPSALTFVLSTLAGLGFIVAVVPLAGGAIAALCGSCERDRNLL